MKLCKRQALVLVASLILVVAQANLVLSQEVPLELGSSIKNLQDAKAYCERILREVEAGTTVLTPFEVKTGDGKTMLIDEYQRLPKDQRPQVLETIRVPVEVKDIELRLSAAKVPVEELKRVLADMVAESKASTGPLKARLAKLEQRLAQEPSKGGATSGKQIVLQGEVVEVNGDKVRISFKGKTEPQVGDPVKITYEITGTDIKADVATGKVAKVEPGFASVDITKKTAEIRKGYLAEITATATSGPAVVREPNIPAGWVEFNSVEGRFKTAFPGSPKELTEFNTKDITFRVYSHIPSLQGKNAFGVTTMDKSEPWDEKELDKLLENVDVQVKILSTKKITLGAYPGREVLAEERGVMMKGRAFLAGNRLYKVSASWDGKKDVPADVDAFLDAFRITTPDVKVVAAAETLRQSRINLRNIGLAFHGFADVNKDYLPAHAIYDKAGKTPLLSWRVAILPWIEQKALFDEFKMDEPWDSEHNKKLIPRMPKIYDCAAAPREVRDAGKTYYQVFTGKDAIFNGIKSMKLFAIPDGSANTILVIEAKEPVIWTKPDDLVLPEDKNALPAVGGLFKDGFHILLGDATVNFVPSNPSASVLRAFVTPSGAESVYIDDLLGKAEKVGSSDLAGEWTMVASKDTAFGSEFTSPKSFRLEKAATPGVFRNPGSSNARVVFVKDELQFFNNASSKAATAKIEADPKTGAIERIKWSDGSVFTRNAGSVVEPKKVGPIVEPKDGGDPKVRDAWLYKINNKDGWVKKGPDKKWLETAVDGVQIQFEEISRTAEHVELFDKSREVTVRLFADRMEWRFGKNGTWARGYEGRWIAPVAAVDLAGEWTMVASKEKQPAFGSEFTSPKSFRLEKTPAGTFVNPGSSNARVELVKDELQFFNNASSKAATAKIEADPKTGAIERIKWSDGSVFTRNAGSVDLSSAKANEYLSDDCSMIFSFDVAAFMKSKLYQELKTQIKEFEGVFPEVGREFSFFGIPVENVARFTAGGNKTREIGIITTLKPISAADIKENAKPFSPFAKNYKLAEVKVGNYTVYEESYQYQFDPKDKPGEVFKGRAFCVVEEKIVIFGGLEAIKKVLQRDRKPVFSRGMAAELESGLTGGYTLIVDVNAMPEQERKSLERELGGAIPGFADVLAGVKVLAVRGSAGDDVAVRATLTCKDKPSAESAKNTADVGLALLKLAFGKGDPQDTAEVKKAKKAVTDVLGTVKLTSQDTHVRAEASIDAVAATAVIRALFEIQQVELKKIKEISTDLTGEWTMVASKDTAFGAEFTGAKTFRLEKTATPGVFRNPGSSNARVVVRGYLAQFYNNAGNKAAIGTFDADPKTGVIQRIEWGDGSVFTRVGAPAVEPKKVGTLPPKTLENASVLDPSGRWEALSEGTKVVVTLKRRPDGQYSAETENDGFGGKATGVGKLVGEVLVCDWTSPKHGWGGALECTFDPTGNSGKFKIKVGFSTGGAATFAGQFKRLGDAPTLPEKSSDQSGRWKESFSTKDLAGEFVWMLQLRPDGKYDVRGGGEGTCTVDGKADKFYVEKVTTVAEVAGTTLKFKWEAGRHGGVCEWNLVARSGLGAGQNVAFIYGARFEFRSKVDRDGAAPPQPKADK